MARLVGNRVSDARRGVLGMTGGMPRIWSVLVVCAWLVAALAVPAVASAAAKAPEAGGNLDLQTWPDSGQLVIVTAITVPESVKLPTTVRIPVPVGATVQWAGEVLGGDLSADPERTHKLVQSPVGGQYAEFTIEQTRTAQVDAAMPALVVSGEKTSASFEWIQSVVSPFTSFSVRVPGAANDVQVSPEPAGQPETNAAGEKLYSGSQYSLDPGKKQTVTFSYSTGKAAPAASANSNLNTLVFVLVAALVVAVIALVVLLSRQRQGASAPPAPPARQRGSSPGTRPSPAEKPQGSASDDDWGFDDEG